MRRGVGRILLFLPSLLWVGAICYFEGIYSFLMVALAALFHECGHLLAFSLLGLPAPKVVPVARGVRLAAGRGLSYREELLIALAGPLANGICFLAGLVFGGRNPALAAFGEVSLMTALCNLAPIETLDGARILTCLLAPHLSDRALFVTRKTVGWVSLYLGLIGSLLILWLTGGGTYTAFLCLGALLMLPCGNSLEEKRGFKRKREDSGDF